MLISTTAACYPVDRACLIALKLQQAEILVMNWKADSDEAAENEKIEQDTDATAHALVIREHILSYLCPPDHRHRLFWSRSQPSAATAASSAVTLATGNVARFRAAHAGHLLSGLPRSA